MPAMPYEPPMPVLGSGNGAQMSAPAASARVPLPAAGINSDCMFLFNQGAAAASNMWIAFGDSNVVAVVGQSWPLPFGKVTTLRIPEGATHMAAIVTATAANLNYIRGRGITQIG